MRYSETIMTRSAQQKNVNRAPRVKLGGTVLFLARLENGRQLRGKLHQLSTTGGLLQLEKPLDEGIKVEVIFHVGDSTVRSKARVLFPMWATQGYLQPFEFDELNEPERSALQANLQKLLKEPGDHRGLRDSKKASRRLLPRIPLPRCSLSTRSGSVHRSHSARMFRSLHRRYLWHISIPLVFCASSTMPRNGFGRPRSMR